MSTDAPIAPEAVCDCVEKILLREPARYLVIQTRYGSVDLPVDEIWYAESTRTLHLSVNLPETP